MKIVAFSTGIVSFLMLLSILTEKEPRYDCSGAADKVQQAAIECKNADPNVHITKCYQLVRQNLCNLVK